MYNRTDFITVIQELESKDDSLMWKTLQGKNLPMCDRRVAQLVQLKILVPIRQGSNCTWFDENHVDRYIECTRLRKQGFKVNQIASHFGGGINCDNIDMTQYQNRKLSNEDKKQILDTIEQLTKLLKDNL